MTESNSSLVEALRRAVPRASINAGNAQDMPTIYVDRENLVAVFRELRDDPALQFALLVEVTSVDFFPAEPRYEVVYHLACLGEAYGQAPARRLRVKVSVPGADPRVPTVTSIYPGAGWPEKVWGEEKLAAVARRLREKGVAPVISWGPGDEPLAERMQGLLPETRRMPALPIHGLARIAAAAEIFVGGDTGPLHLADAMGTRTLALFGPTDPERNGPYRGHWIRFDASTTPERVASRALEILESRP